MRWWLVAVAALLGHLRRLQAPDIQAVEVFYFALGAGPFATAQVELNLDFLALAEGIEIVTAVAGHLKEDVLRVLAVVDLNHELTLGEALGYLLGLEYLVDLASGLDCHAAENTGRL